MRAISLATEPLTVSYALRQLVETGELAVFNAGDKAAVLIPLEKYQALVDVLRGLEAPPEPVKKSARSRKSSSRTRPVRPAGKKAASKRTQPEMPPAHTADMPSLF
jgi:PHD/YefM family antitoxin component YafN of YafNO toxin-antitoxin module